MSTIDDSSKLLKTLQLSDYTTLIEDINYNFSVLLSSPLFVGTQGAAGADGSQGVAGIRGSKWMYCFVDLFNEQYPDDKLSGEYQITLDYLNTKLSNDADRNALLSATGAGDMFVNGDTFVVNSRIYVLDLDNNEFIDTNQNINSNSDVILSTLQEYVTNLVETTLSEDLVYMGLTQTVDTTNAQAKNYPDASSNINNTILDNSLLDITTSTSQSGTEILTHKVFTPSSKMVNDSDNVMWVFGEENAYHNLVQNTLSFNEAASNNTISGYGPTYANTPAAVFMQNTWNSGIMLGHRYSDNFADFANMYVNESRELVFHSPLSTDHALRFSDILLSNEAITLSSTNVNLNANVNVTGALSGTSIDIIGAISTIDDKVIVGEAETPTHIESSSVVLDSYDEIEIVSIDESGEIIDSGKKFDAATTGSSLQDSVDYIPNSKVIRELYSSIQSLQDSTTTMASSIATVADTTSTDINTLNTKLTDSINSSPNVSVSTIPGVSFDIYISNINEYQWNVMRALLFDESGQGRTSVSYSTFIADYTDIDISSLYICDGSSNSPELVTYDGEDNLSTYKITVVQK